VDLSSSFVDTANQLKAGGRLPYSVCLEGELVEQLEALVDPAIDRSRVEFRVGDACELPDELGSFDAVLVANLLCRVPNPSKVLDGVARLLVPGGLVLITSPFTWLEEYTNQSQWIGGHSGVRSADALRAALQTRRLRIVSEDSMPLVIRETSRKYQLILTHRVVAQKV